MKEPVVTLERPWLVFDLGRPMQVLSWAMNRPGLVSAGRIVWREVRDADLPEGFDVDDWLDRVLAERGESASVAFLTSRDVSSYRAAEAKVGVARALVVATVGLSNAERVGHRLREPVKEFGTVNIAVSLSPGLSEPALIEAMSIAVEARTTAILDAGIRSGRRDATGTGTDCLAVAAPLGTIRHAGLHTEVGEVVGRAVYDAVHAGAKEWRTFVEKTAHA